MTEDEVAARIAQAVHHSDIDELERIGPRAVARLADRWRAILERLDSNPVPQRARAVLAAFLERAQGFTPEQARRAAEALLSLPRVIRCPACLPP